jgi:hypothetical protein
LIISVAMPAVGVDQTFPWPALPEPAVGQAQRLSKKTAMNLFQLGIQLAGKWQRVWRDTMGLGGKRH